MSAPVTTVAVILIAAAPALRPVRRLRYRVTGWVEYRCYGTGHQPGDNGACTRCRFRDPG